MNRFRISFLIIAAALFIMGGCKEEVEKTFGIELSQTDTHNFPSVKAGSYTVTPLTVTVTNTGNQATGALQIVLNGTSSASFESSTTSISVEAGKTATFTVAPKLGLPKENYTATVTVSGNANIVAQSFFVVFVVSEGDTYIIELSEVGTHEFDTVEAGSGYTVSALTVTVSNRGNQPTGALQIALSGTAANKFELSTNAISGIDPGKSTTFTVKPISSLANGDYSATVTVSGSEKIEPQSFVVSFTVLDKAVLEIISPPSKTVYGVMEPFDLTGLVVKTTTGSPVEITANDLVYNFSEPGEKTVTIDKEGFSEVEIGVIITVKSLAERIAGAAGKTETITVYGNELVEDAITINAANSVITLTTAGNTECVIKKVNKAGVLIEVAAGAKLTIGGYVTLKGLSTATYGGTDDINNNTYLVAVKGTGYLEMKGHAKVTGNTNFYPSGTSHNYGSGISLDAATGDCAIGGGTLILSENSEVSNNKCVNTRGAVAGSTCYAYGAGVQSNYYGKVYIRGEAKITNNQAIANSRAFGGGFYQRNFGVCYMEGGEISANVCDAGGQAVGGGMHVSDANTRFFMSGGVFKDNVLKFGTAGRGCAMTVTQPRTVILSGSASIIGKPTEYSEKEDRRNAVTITNNSRLNIKGVLTTADKIIIDVHRDWFYDFQTNFYPDAILSPARPVFQNSTGEFNNACPIDTGDNPAAVDFTDNAPVAKFQLGRSLNPDTGEYFMLDTEVEIKPDGYFGLKE